VPLEPSLLIPRLSIDERCDDTIRCPAEDGGGRRILPG
jgi:hypothetical protein